MKIRPPLSNVAVFFHLLLSLALSSHVTIRPCWSFVPNTRHDFPGGHKSKLLSSSSSSDRRCRTRHRALSVLHVAVDVETIANVAGSLALPLLGVAAFRIGAALAVIGQPRLPDIRGGGAVGSKVIRLDRSGARVRLFYPCDNTHNNDKAPYCTDGRLTSDGMAGLVGFRQLGLSFLLAHVADADSGCYEDAPPSLQDTTPLFVYSHGYGGNMDMATYLLRTVASKGVLVAAVEHTDGTASSTVLANGERLDFQAAAGAASLTRRADEIVEAAAVVGTTYGTTQVFYGGHSYGCPSAILAADRHDDDPHVDGLLLHDPALAMGFGLLPPTSEIPSLSYTSDEYHRAGVRYGDRTLHVQGAYHGNFVDAPLWAPAWVMRPLSMLLPVMGPADPNRVHEELADSALAFMTAVSVHAEGVMGNDGGIDSLFERID